MKSFHPESLGAWWKHGSRREHFILNSNLLSIHVKRNLFTPSLLNCKEKTVLRQDLKWIAKFFSGTVDSKEWGSVIPLIHHIPKLNVTASTGILNLDIRKPCLLIFFSMVEEVVASRAILLKLTVCLLGTHFPNPMNAARALRLLVRQCISKNADELLRQRLTFRSFALFSEFVQSLSEQKQLYSLSRGKISRNVPRSKVQDYRLLSRQGTPMIEHRMADSYASRLLQSDRMRG